MGLLDGLIGGAVGAEMVTVVNQLIQQHGGLPGIVSQLQQQGLGATVNSWIGTGPNQPISPEQVHQSFDPELMRELAAKTGLTPQDLAQRLSQVLPQVIEELRQIAEALNTGAPISPIPAIPLPPCPTRHAFSRRSDQERTFDDEIPF